MAEVVSFESREQKLNNAIQGEVDKIRSETEIQLPKSDAPIVGDYIRKLEGTYDVSRAKKDTDNAVDLLYIAYNATPQDEETVRNQISDIMDRLIKAQQASERSMKDALKGTTSILGTIGDYFPDWLDVKDEDDTEEIKGYVGGDLRELADEIRKKAEGIREDLNKIAKTYDEIIADTHAATSSSETALGGRIKKKKQLENEINEANAERERLESLVADLTDQVDKFDKMARDFESRAETAEERAFVMSIVRVAAQTISAAIPPIAMAASGPSSFLAASALNSASNARGNGSGSGGGDDDNTEDVIEAKKQISERQAELKASEARKKELKEKIADLKSERDKLAGAATGSGTTDTEASGEGDEGEAGTAAEKPAEEAKENPEIAALDKRIADAEAELKEEEEKGSAIGATLAGLQASLNQLDQSLSEMTDEQQSQAAKLREMQMKMLDKVEAYEKERRQQAAELVKINALLKGKRSEEETLELAVKSLNLSISALKRTKEIIVEIAFFFKSFADFMKVISDQASERVESIDRVVAKEKLRERARKALIDSTDEFFIRQTAQWQAVMVVSDKFVQNFADGWSQLNKLSGTYITGDKLSAYLQKASVTLAEISAEREAAANQHIADLDRYREKVLYGETGS